MNSNKNDMRVMGVLAIGLIIVFFVINIVTSQKRIDSKKYGEFFELKSGHVYTLVQETREIDYIKVLHNEPGDQKINVQFLLKPRLATEVAEPWLTYEELNFYLRNEKVSLVENADTALSRMFLLKNN